MTLSIEQCLSPFHVHSTLLSTRITNSRLKGNKWLKEPVIRQLRLQTSTNATYPYCRNIHSPLLHYITLFPLDAVVWQWIYLLLWLLSHMYTRPRSHMSQWTCIITLTLKNTSALLTARCIPSYFNSMSSYIHHRTVSYMHSVVKQYILQLNHNLVLKYMSVQWDTTW